jgi:hypothetical protein
MILVDVLLCWLFAAGNLIIDYVLNHLTVMLGGPVGNSWNPFYVTRVVTDGPDNVFPNFPFFIFWITIAVNLYFIFKLQRDNETRPN